MAATSAPATTRAARPARTGSTTEGPARHRIRHVPGLDGLRGAAVAGVLVYHGNHLRGGYLGVDLFFVLSGYLITSILLTEYRNSGEISLSNFWVRRARRLFPAMIAVLLVVAIFAHFVASPRALGGIRTDGFSTLFYVANWHTILAGTSYWAATTAPSPLKHTWSLAIEEQFYVVWPLLVLALLHWRDSFRLVFRVTIGLLVASASLMVLLAAGGANKNTLYLGTHTRAGAILMGAALACWHIRRGHTENPRTRTALELAALASMGVLAVLWATVDIESNFLYLGGMALAGVSVTVVVAAVTHPDELLVAKIFAWAPLRWLGLISYGMYLWSWPIYQFLTPERTGLDGLPLLGFQVFASLGVAILSYVLLEQPIRRGALTPVTARVAVPAAAAVAVIALIAGTLGAESAPGQAAGSVNTAGYQVSSKPGATKLLVVGDSVPELIADQGITPLRDELGVSVLDRSVPGCVLLRALGPVKGIEGNIRNDVTPCENGWKDGVIKQYSPQVVMLMFGQFPNDQVQLGGDFKLPCTPEYQQKETEQLTAAVHELGSGGAKVVLVTAPGSTVSWIVDAAPPGMNDRVACMNDIYRKVAAAEANVELVDFAPYICPSKDDCKDSIDGVNLREDTIHYEKASAELVARWIVPRVLDAARTGS